MQSADNPRSKLTGPADRNTPVTDLTFPMTHELMLLLLQDMIGPSHISGRASFTDEAVKSCSHRLLNLSKHSAVSLKGLPYQSNNTRHKAQILELCRTRLLVLAMENDVAAGL